jgi:hypothetical protein
MGEPSWYSSSTHFFETTPHLLKKVNLIIRFPFLIKSVEPKVKATCCTNWATLFWINPWKLSVQHTSPVLDLRQSHSDRHTPRWKTCHGGSSSWFKHRLLPPLAINHRYDFSAINHIKRKSLRISLQTNLFLAVMGWKPVSLTPEELIRTT